MRRLGLIFFMALAVWFSRSVAAQQAVSLNAQTPKPNPHWREMFENKPAALKEEEPPVHRQEVYNLEAIKEEEKAAPSPLWGDARSRRETRRTRAEKIKQLDKIEEEGKTATPDEETLPPVLSNERSRRNARVERYELRQKEEELKAKMGLSDNDQK